MLCDEATIPITVSDVNIKFSVSMSTWDDFDDYSTRIEGTIVCVDKKGNERIVGRVRLFHLDIGATYDTNDSLHDLFDIRPETAPSIQHSSIMKLGISNPNWKESSASTFAI